MSLRRAAVKTFWRNIFGACFLVVALAAPPTAAIAHGAGGHAIGPAIGHGFYGGGPHSFYWRGFAHGYHHSAHFGRHFALHGFGRWTGHGSFGGHVARRQPGHWHAASGFGGGGRWYDDGM